jgi:hypothetical protein
VLEECDPVVLVLVLTLVLVGRPSAGARSSKKSVLLAFLFSIRHLQNYKEKHGEMMMYQGLLLKDLVSTSTMVHEYVRMKKHQETEIHFLVTRKRNFVSETLKWNSVSIPLETKFCFHST